MAIYLAGTGPHIVALPMTGGTAISTGSVDTAWVTNSIYVSNTNNIVDTVPFSTPVNEGWFHHESYYGSPQRNSGIVAGIYNTAGVMVFRIVYSGTSGMLLAQRWSGSAWVSLGNIWESPGGRFQFDTYIKAAVSGVIEVYQDKVKVVDVTGDFSAMVQMNKMAFGNPRTFGSDSAYHSQILVADFSTLFSKVKQTVFNAAGSLQQWAGTVGDINEPIPDNTTALTTSAADKVSTFTAPARDFTGYDVKAVILLWSGQRAGSTSPPKVRPVLRIGGVNYNGVDVTTRYGNQSASQIFENNPATAAAWTPTAAGAATVEFGFESRA